MRQNKNSLFILIILLLLVSCTAPVGSQELTTVNSSQIPQPTTLSDVAGSPATATPFQPDQTPDKIYWSPAVPAEWIQVIGDLQQTNEIEIADLVVGLEGKTPKTSTFTTFTRVYAVGAPFPTVTDGISLLDLKMIWQGQSSITGEFSKLVLTQETLQVFRELWGSPSDSSVTVLAKENLVNEIWNSTDTLGILPFEAIEPRLKILKVDGISPLDRPMDTKQYGLSITYTVSGDEKNRSALVEEINQLTNSNPATNRDESKMTVIIMTGTTALARVTLRKIELNGYDYPIEMVKDWFLSADLRHVSNEVAFNDSCQYTDPFVMQFCSKPDQIKVLENLGINVVESTGNHMNDYEGDSFLRTLQMYQQRGWLSFGGGVNAESAKQPATTEVNGNKIAFIGCNHVGFETAWATETRAGAANCDYDWFYQQIKDLKQQGYVVIATYQFIEIDEPMYSGKYRDTFQEAAMAGADIVQGSQAHVPMGFEFVDDSLIHYGLGNFLFDQMEPQNIREFIDRHIVYNGKYIGTELLTATLTDWSKPIPMIDSERRAFLNEIFTASGMR